MPLATGLLLAMLALSPSLAVHAAQDAPPPSQSRAEHDDFEQAYVRYLEGLGGGAREERSAYSDAVPLNQADFSDLPVWEDVTAGFELARDTRHLTLPEKPGFPRRASWLYPDDGCFARAAVTGRMLEQEGWARPRKLFIFGNLRVRTRNSASGYVYWWYHVVPLVSDGERAIVLDPAIEPSRPLPVREWVARMTPNPGNVRVAVCNVHAYEPDSSCLRATNAAENPASGHQRDFLRREWNRLLELGRSPTRELGDQPPWSFITETAESDFRSRS